MDQRIVNDLGESYGFVCRSFSRVKGGFKNELWRVETQNQTLLLKVFSAERFSPEKLENINAALLLQQAAHEMDVPCPQVYLANGRAVRCMADISYMVMGYCAGRNETPESVSAAQLRSLGAALAKTHAALAHLPQNLPGYAHAPEKLLEKMNALAKENESVAAIARTWTMEKLKNIPSGLAHEDMTADNVLFDETGVTAVIDFDRCCYGYPLHDVGRALLSFALKDGALQTDAVSAFAQGYRSVLPLSREDIKTAIELTWLIEAPWWLPYEKLTGKARRFREEISFLTTHYADAAIKID